ncbi:MAG: tyrosine-protein phosphatase [Planctomycetes bacterium]|nr:tyrosine-protein phosphatase [Planctomycetota bacterium]
MRRGLPRLFPASVLLIFSATCAVDPRVSTVDARGFGQKIEVPGISHFAEVAPGLYRGAQPSEAGFQNLKDRGVRTIINLREFHSDIEKARGYGFRVLELPMQGNALGSEPPTPAQIEYFFSALANRDNWPVFVHCAAGCDRTGTMIALYRIEADAWTNARAVEEMRAFGYHEYYKDLVRFVEQYKPAGLWRK